MKLTVSRKVEPAFAPWRGARGVSSGVGACVLRPGINISLKVVVSDRNSVTRIGGEVGMAV